MAQDTVANLADTPYAFVRRLSKTEIELGYRTPGGGQFLERWRLATLPNVTGSPYVIMVQGKGYRFAGQQPDAGAFGRRGGSVSSDAKRHAARVNGAKGGRPRKVR